MLLGGLVQGYTSGVFFQGFGAFFTPIAEQLGWSRGATALATSIQRAGQSVLSPFAGMAFDRFGPRWLIALGLFTIGVSFILMSRSQELWHFYGSVLLLTLGLSFGTFIVLVGTVSNWFIRKRSRAISVLMACTAVGGMAVPLLVLVIDTYGWRETMVGVGVGFWIIAVPAVALIRRRPEQYGLVPDGEESPSQARARGQQQEAGRQRSPREFQIPVRAALRTRFFWQLALGTSLGHMMTGTTILHIDAMQSFGISRGVAGLAVFGVAASSFAGRLRFGFLGDMMDKRVLMALA
ncbi:MAG: MFS transporter, partial [Chloroflexota bacterium]